MLVYRHKVLQVPCVVSSPDNSKILTAIISMRVVLTGIIENRDTSQLELELLVCRNLTTVSETYRAWGPDRPLSP